MKSQVRRPSPPQLTWLDRIQAFRRGAGEISCIGCRRAGNAQLAWDVDRIRGCNHRELRLGVQLGVRRTTGDRRLMVFRGREGEGRGVQAGKIPARGPATWGIYNPPLAISLHLEFALPSRQLSQNQSDYLYPLVPFALVLYNGLCWDGFCPLLSPPADRPASRWAANGLQPTSPYSLCEGQQSCISWTK